MTPDTLKIVTDSLMAAPDTLSALQNVVATNPDLTNDTLHYSLDKLLTMIASNQDTFTKMSGWANVKAHHGLFVAVAGQVMTFVALILISGGVWLANTLFNKVFTREIESDNNKYQKAESRQQPEIALAAEQDIPIEHKVAVFTAIELYRRLHFGKQNAKMTFRHGSESWNSWKLGKQFGQRETQK